MGGSESGGHHLEPEKDSNRAEVRTHRKKLSPEDVCVCAKLLQSCPTLCHSMDCSLPGSSVRGILQASSGLPFPSSGGLPNPGVEPAPLKFPALAGGFFTSSATWEAQALKILVCNSKAKIIPELPSKGNQQNPPLNSIPCFFFA